MGLGLWKTKAPGRLPFRQFPGSPAQFHGSCQADSDWLRPDPAGRGEKSMTSQLRLVVVVLTALAVIGLVTGCPGARKVKITGKITKDGKPLNVPKDQQVTLTFAPEAETGQTYP